MEQRTPHTVKRKGTKGAVIFGILLFLFISTGVQLIIDPTDPTDSSGTIGAVVLTLLLCLVFAWRLYIAVRRISLANKYGDYFHALQISKTNNLREMAEMLNKPETEILRNLKAMEKEQLFPSLLIHPDGTVDARDYMSTTVFSSIKNVEEKAAEMISVTCPGCGAKTLLRPSTGQACPYCSTHLTAPQKH